MIELLPIPDGRRVALTCDACGLPVTRAADACLVPWASRTALICHHGECLAALRLQYPSTAGEPLVEVADAVDEFVKLLGDQAGLESASPQARHERLIREIASISEAAYRRGFYHGHKAASRGDALSVDLPRWRYCDSTHRATVPLGISVTSAVRRLRMSHADIDVRIAAILEEPVGDGRSVAGTAADDLVGRIEED